MGAQPLQDSHVELADPARLRHNRAAVRSDELSRELAALEEEIAALRKTEEEERSAVAALESQLTAMRDRLTLAQGELTSRERLIEDKRSEFEQAVAEEAHERVEQVAQEREKVAAAFADAATVLLDRLGELDRLQDAMRGAWRTAQAADGADRAADLPLPPELGAEPEPMREAWERLCNEVRKRINDQFEDELVEAASRSSLGSAIDDLPVHLRELARQRRHALVRRVREAEAESGIS
jgi:hypothetical protein